MTSDNSTRENEARTAAVDMLRRGLATPSEIAALAGVSRQLVRYWAIAAQINPAKMRDAWLVKEWRKRLSAPAA